MKNNFMWARRKEQFMRTRHQPIRVQPNEPIAAAIILLGNRATLNQEEKSRNDWHFIILA